MTPYTAALTYRVRIATAARYAHYITENDPDTLQRWGDTYKTGDIKQWARERIANILAEASKLLPLFAGDESICLSVQNAARDSLEVLGQIGCLDGNAETLSAGIMRIDARFEHGETP